MKIVIGVHHFPPRYNGGAEWRAHRTARALQRRGHSVRVIAVERIDVGVGNRLTYVDDTFEGVDVRRLSFNLAAAPDRAVWEYDNPWIGDHLREYLASVGPDIFHLIGGYLMTGRALRVAQAMGLPTVLTLTDFWFLCKRIAMVRSDGGLSTFPTDPVSCARCVGEEQRRYRWLGRVMPKVMDAYWGSRNGPVDAITARSTFLLETLRGVDAIISPSQFLARTFIASGVGRERICFVRQGHDSHATAPLSARKSASPVLRLGYMGQIAPLKGIHVLFDAIHAMPSAAIEVKAYGDPQTHPHYADQLRRQIGNDPRIRMMGLYGRGELSGVLAECDVVVVPSLWYENSPNIILEAFGHGVPVIATDLGGMAELVQSGLNGLRFEVGSASDLARQIGRLIDEPGLLDRLRDGAARSTPPSVEDEMESLCGLYSRLLDGARR